MANPHLYNKSGSPSCYASRLKHIPCTAFASGRRRENRLPLVPVPGKTYPPAPEAAHPAVNTLADFHPDRSADDGQ